MQGRGMERNYFWKRVVTNKVHACTEIKHPQTTKDKATCNRASLVTQTVKNLPARQETWIQSLGLEDPLEKGTATDCSSAQSRPTLCDPMDCSPLGSCVRRIFQAKILEWVTISFSRGSSRPRN